MMLVLFALASIATPALGASYGVTVQTDHASYTGIAQITISGMVSPAPGPNTAVVVVVSNPDHATVDIESDPVNPTTGSFSQVTVAGGGISCGGSHCWIAGAYLVNATWGGPGVSLIATATFAYLPITPDSTSVSCAPASFAVGATSQCTASISGGSGISIDGETVTFSQTGGTGSVTFPPPATCALSGNSCSVTVTGGSPGQATIQASYPGDASNAASSATASVTVLAATTTSVSCTPSDVGIGAASTCTATVAGAVGTIAGETVTFSQLSSEIGSVTISPPGTCDLGSAGSCSISVTGAAPGAVTVEAAYPGDAENGASSGTASLTALFIHSTVTASTSSSSTSSSVSTSSASTNSTSSSTSPTASSTTNTGVQPSSVGLGTAAYLILAAVAVIVIALGVVMWRRKAAGDRRNQAVAK